MAYTDFPRGTAGILKRARDLASFARRYDYAGLMTTRTGNANLGDAVELLIAAIDLFESADNDPYQADAVSPGVTPEDVEV